MRRYLLFALVIVFSFHSSAQIIPIEGDTLNYRLVGFSVPQNPKAASYMLEIAEGNFSDDKDFRKNVIVSEISKNSKIIATVPAFAKTYTWRVAYLNKKSKARSYTGLSHFSTGYTPRIDANKHRLRIIDSATQHNEDLLVFLDYSRVLYNLKGEPLWYLPAIPSILDEYTTVRDLKITPQGTITFLSGHKAFEVDYDGKLLWSPPNDGKVSKDTSEFYHHEFTRLANGHYMILGDEFLHKRLPEKLDTCLFENDPNFTSKDGIPRVRIAFGTLIEYDSSGKVVWSWKSSHHFNDDDLFKRETRNGHISPTTHLNAFFFDEKNNHVYMSFRDINRILKINYPEGELINSYGIFKGRENLNNNRNPDKKREIANPWFKGQHACRLSNEGYLYMFNNNTQGVRGSFTSYVSIYKETPDNAVKLAKVWDFGCDIDNNTLNGTPTGGSVYMLPDNCILSNMGAAGRSFIVNPEKKIVWNALSENWDDDRKAWSMFAQYKASYITYSKLNDLIFRQ